MRCMFLLSDSHLLAGNCLYERKTKNVVQVLNGHSDVVTGCAADGKESFLVTASADKTLAIHDIPKEIQRNVPIKEN